MLEAFVPGRASRAQVGDIHCCQVISILRNPTRTFPSVTYQKRSNSIADALSLTSDIWARHQLSNGFFASTKSPVAIRFLHSDSIGFICIISENCIKLLNLKTNKCIVPSSLSVSSLYMARFSTGESVGSMPKPLSESFAIETHTQRYFCEKMLLCCIAPSMGECRRDIYSRGEAVAKSVCRLVGS